MQKLQKITLLITMAVVTWKVWKIESNTREPSIDLKKIKPFEIPKQPENANDSARRLLKAASQYCK